MDFAIPTDHRLKVKENEKKDKYLDLVGNWKKNQELESDNYTNCDKFFCYSYEKFINGTGEQGNKITSGKHPINYIIENGQNTEKSPGDLRTLTPVKDHQLTLIWKTL